MTRPTNNPPTRPLYMISRIAFGLSGAVFLACLYALVTWTAPEGSWLWPVLRGAGVLTIAILIRDLLEEA